MEFLKKLGNISWALSSVIFFIFSEFALNRYISLWLFNSYIHWINIPTKSQSKNCKEYLKWHMITKSLEQEEAEDANSQFYNFFCLISQFTKNFSAFYIHNFYIEKGSKNLCFTILKINLPLRASCQVTISQDFLPYLSISYFSKAHFTVLKKVPPGN